MQRSCRLRCCCFVTPRAVSSCNTNCRPEDCTAWTKLGSSLKQMDSTMITVLYFRPVYASLLFNFTSVCLLLANFSWFLLFWFLFRCLPFSNLSSTLTNYPSPVSWHGRASIPNRMSFLSNKIVPWAVFPVFVRFDIILIWYYIGIMFSLCSAIINASSTSSSLQVPFPSPVIFHFCIWAILERFADCHCQNVENSREKDPSKDKEITKRQGHLPYHWFSACEFACGARMRRRN